MSNVVLTLLVIAVVTAGGCQRPDIHRMIQRTLQAPQGSPKVLAVYMPWFGEPNHMDVGYSSQDPNVLRRQIEQASNMGITAFVVDWYGRRRPFLDESFALLQQVAAEKNFQVALLYNEPEDNTGQATEDAIAALNWAYQRYIGPEAPYAQTYFTHNERPVIFVFPKHGRTDWSRVRERVNTWSVSPLLFYKDEARAEFASDFDGYYAWVHPGRSGWHADGSNWGKQYLKNFYHTMKNKYPDKIAVGAAWPGFDDTLAHWGLNRRMDSRCGKTLDETLQLFTHYHGELDSLPFLLIVTWNDYEEGTAIEQPVFSDCASSARNAHTMRNSSLPASFTTEIK